MTVCIWFLYQRRYSRSTRLEERGTCQSTRSVWKGDGEQSAPVKEVSVRRCRPIVPSHRGRENKRQCARARSSCTKPGHAEIMRPAQWVANKRGALLILHQLIFTARLNPRLEFDKFSRKIRESRATIKSTC